MTDKQRLAALEAFVADMAGVPVTLRLLVERGGDKLPNLIITYARQIEERLAALTTRPE